MNQKTIKFGMENPNYKHGRYCIPHFCKDCGKPIDKSGRSERCHHCESGTRCGLGKGRRHTEKSRKLIGLASKRKFTRAYIKRIHDKHRDGRRRVDGYVIIKDYEHPNKNSHDDVLEHIKVLGEHLGRPLRRGEIVHHINFIRDDNRVSNLHLYENRGAHMEATRSLNRLVSPLLKAGIIRFEKGTYVLS